MISIYIQIIQHNHWYIIIGFNATIYGEFRERGCAWELKHPLFQLIFFLLL